MDFIDVERDLRLLSAACYRGDGAEVVRLLTGRDPGLLLQQPVFTPEPLTTTVLPVGVVPHERRGQGWSLRVAGAGRH